MTLEAKKKLIRLLRSKTVSDITFVRADLFAVFTTSTTTKRGTWILPKMVLDVYGASWKVHLHAPSRRTMRASIEDVRHALAPESLSSLLLQEDDALDVQLEAVLVFHPSADASVQHNVSYSLSPSPLCPALTVATPPS